MQETTPRRAPSAGPRGPRRSPLSRAPTRWQPPRSIIAERSSPSSSGCCLSSRDLGRQTGRGVAPHYMKGPEEKRTKTKNLGRASAQVENSSLQKTPVFEDSGEALSSYWLMKSEPESRLEKGVDVKFSIEDLQAQPRQTTCWDGVRNYQARNFLRAMRLDEEAFFYHSNCREPGIAGLVKIVKEAYPDHTQFEKNNPHYDASSKEDNPKWSMVDVQFVRTMKRFIPLAELRAHHQAHRASGGPLKNMALFTHQRLSVQRLTREEFDFILSLEEKEPS